MKLKFWKKDSGINFLKNIKRNRIIVQLNEVFSSLATAIYVALGWLGVTGTGAAAFASVATVAAKVLIIAGSVYYSFSQAAKLKKQDRSILNSGHLVNISSIESPVPIVYGTCRLGGNIVYRGVSGSNNRYLNIVMTFSEGPVEGIAQDDTGDKIWLDDKRIQEYPSSLYYYEFYTGTPNQTVCSALQQQDSNWDDALRYTAYLYIRLTYNKDYFLSVPNITIELKGRKLYDPRSGGTSYSDNPALVTYDFLTNSRYSIGISADLFDEDYIKDLANWCDENDYHFNGVIMDQKEIIDQLEDILLNYHGACIWSSGQYKLLPYSYDTPVMSLTEDDIDADSFKINVPGIPETPNKVHIKFIDKDRNYSSQIQTIEDVDAIGIDLQERIFEFMLNGTTDIEQATKLGKYYIRRNRKNYSFSFSCHPRALALDPMDIIQVTHPLLQMEEKMMRVTQIEVLQDGRCGLVCVEEDSSIYDDTVSFKTQYFYEPPQPDPYTPPPDVTNLNVEELSVVTGIKISFTIPPSYTNWDHAEVLISDDNGITWKTITTIISNPVVYYYDVIAGNTYKIKVISYSNFNIQSLDPPTYPISITGVSGPSVSNLQATVLFKSVMLEWSQVSNPNVFNYEIWGSQTNDRSTASFLGESAGTNFVHNVNGYGITFYYWIRTKNKNGTYGPWYPANQYGGISATTVQISSNDLLNSSVLEQKLADSAVTASKIASGAVGGTHIVEAAIDTAHLKDACIQSAKIGDLQVLESKIANGAITSAKIAEAAIQSAHIEDLAVENAKINNLAVNTAKIANLAVTRGGHYYNANSVTLPLNSTDRVELASINVTTNTSGDWVLLIGFFQITQAALEVGKGDVYPIPIDFEIFYNNYNGTLISSCQCYGYYELGNPVLLGVYVPPSSGTHTFKAYARHSVAPGLREGKVGYRKLIGLAISK